MPLKHARLPSQSQSSLQHTKVAEAQSTVEVDMWRCVGVQHNEMLQTDCKAGYTCSSRSQKAACLARAQCTAQRHVAPVCERCDDQAPIVTLIFVAVREDRGRLHAQAS